MVEAESDAARFWRFALDVYMPEENRVVFLRAQDKGGADVPLVLFCLWCGVEGVRLSADAMRAAVEFSATWRAVRVEPLRALRREWKTASGDLPPALSESARHHVAKAEQAVERLQMEHLVTLRSGEADPVGAAWSNLACYRQYCDLALSDGLLEELEGCLRITKVKDAAQS